MRRELEVAIDAVQKAGQLVMSYFGRQVDIRDKSNNTPVTQADLASDQLLRSIFQNHFPDDSWLSEESQDYNLHADNPRIWIVDPLDGTKEFIRGIEEFTVCVALVEASRPVLAVVYNPATRELFHAEKGQGAYRNGSRAVLSGCRALGDVRIVSSHHEPDLVRPLQSIGDMTHVGSIAYKLAMVSAGAADLVISLDPKYEWDICAGEMLVSEAGGRVTDFHGSQLLYNRENLLIQGVIAANEDLHPLALSWVHEHFPLS